jgi:hypothetical protein
MQNQVLLNVNKNLYSSEDTDTILIADINFTKSQLNKVVKEAIDFHQTLPDCVIGMPGTGLVNCLKKTPDWAGSLIRKKGIVEAVIEKMGSWSFVKRRADNTEPYISYVKKCFDEKAPLIFRVGFGPLKNINLNICAQRPDIAEYLTIIQLARLVSAIAILYPYGVKAQLVPDDLRTQTANCCPVVCTKSYIDTLVDLVENLGFSTWLTVERGQQRLYEEYKVHDYWQKAEESLLQWKMQDPESFSLKWQSACENAAKNISKVSNDNIKEEAQAAAWRYLTAHKAENLSGMWAPTDVFPLRYGNHPGSYQLYSLFHKNTKLPWQITLPTSLLPDVKIPGL